MNNYFVYRHLFPNGKSYIGITCQNPPEKRWNNGSGYYYQPKMRNAIKKYKWKNVTHEIIAQGLSVEQASMLEREFIKKFDSFRNGYNQTEGGEGGSLGAKHTPESINKISQSMRGNHNGSPDCFRNYQKTVGSWNSHPVEVSKLSDDASKMIFKSITEAARHLNLSPSHICHRLKESSSVVLHGYVWRRCDG
jgi:hypothetical protein